MADNQVSHPEAAEQKANKPVYVHSDTDGKLQI